MLFALLCKDKPDSLDLRMETRPTHVEHLQSIGENLKGAGPTLDEYGKPNGSLVIIEAEDRAAAEDFANRDPYAKAGLFQSVTVMPWNWLLANPYND